MMMKNVLIIGSGAREHAIALACARSSLLRNLYCIGSNRNPGIMRQTADYAVVSLDDHAFICDFAKQHAIDLCLIGPEAPLATGLADALTAIGVGVIGPTKALARIETDKAYARDLMQRHHISGLPTYKVFTELTGVETFLHTLGEGKYVVKATGLMGGKGVKVAGEHLASISEAIDYAASILARQQAVVIEEKLIGQEFSAMCFTDGKTILPMPLVQDHKRAYVGDTGPNTGGMGSYSDADHSLPFLKPSDMDEAVAINRRVIDALFAETGERYHGILYGSFIATATGIAVIEFNARFGDPEALNVLPILQTDFIAICDAIVNETLKEVSVLFASSATVCKYAVPVGYPDHPKKNIPLAAAWLQEKAGYFYGAVDVEGEQALATGSRALASVGIAESIQAAERIAEEKIQLIQGDFFHRADIGTDDALNRRIFMMQQVRSL